MFNVRHYIQTFLHFLQFAVSYFLMLAFMTFNYWLCLSILIGITIGFFVFGVKREKNNLNEECCNWAQKQNIQFFLLTFNSVLFI